MSVSSNIPYKCFKFPGGELQVQITDLNSVHMASRVRIEANIQSSDDVMELLLLTDAIRRVTSTDITLYLDYLPYARQDRVCNEGESLSLKVFCDLINAQRYSRVYVWDCHSDVGLALLNNVEHVHMSSFVSRVPEVKNFILVSPDAGARKKTLKCAQELGLSQIVFADKIRDVKTGNITGTVISGSTGISDPTGYDYQKFLVVDDICDRGRTFLELAKALKDRFVQPELHLYVTHGIFSHEKGVEVFRGIYEKVYCPNVFKETTSDLLVNI